MAGKSQVTVAVVNKRRGTPFKKKTPYKSAVHHGWGNQRTRDSAMNLKDIGRAPVPFQGMPTRAQAHAPVALRPEDQMPIVINPPIENDQQVRHRLFDSDFFQRGSQQNKALLLNYNCAYTKSTPLPQTIHHHL